MTQPSWQQAPPAGWPTLVRQSAAALGALLLLALLPATWLETSAAGELVVAEPGYQALTHGSAQLLVFLLALLAAIGLRLFRLEPALAGRFVKSLRDRERRDSLASDVLMTVLSTLAVATLLSFLGEALSPFQRLAGFTGAGLGVELSLPEGATGQAPVVALSYLFLFPLLLALAGLGFPLVRRFRERYAPNLRAHMVLILVTVVTLYPLMMVLRIALTPGQGFSQSLSPIPEEVTFDNFVAVVSETSDAGEWLFGQQLLNSVIIALATTVLGVLLATTAAYAFSRFRFAGRKVGLMAFLVSQMFPGVLMMIPLYLIMQKLDLLNAPLGLILVYATTAIPFCVWMLKGYFDTIPKELEESAIMDGASQFTIFWRIILPLSMPAVAVTALFSFMTAWNEFVLAFTFMDEPSSHTLPVMVNSYVGEKAIEWGKFAASSVLVSIPVMALFFALQKNLVGGLTAGSVKG